MSGIEKATLDYLEAICYEFGGGSFEITLESPAYKSLLNSLIPERDTSLFNYHYDHFTWNTQMGPVVIRRMP